MSSIKKTKINNKNRHYQGEAIWHDKLGFTPNTHGYIREGLWSDNPMTIDSAGNPYEIYSDKYRVHINKDQWNDTLSIANGGRGIGQESVSTIIRSNLASHYGKTLDIETMQNITNQIIESIDYVLNKK